MYKIQVKNHIDMGIYKYASNMSKEQQHIQHNNKQSYQSYQ